MVILKKIKSATMMETLIATVLVVVVFMVASLTLNNIFSNTNHRDKKAINVHLNQLEYYYLHHKIDLPYEENFKNWEITFLKDKEGEVSLKAIQVSTKKEVLRTINRHHD